MRKYHKRETIEEPTVNLTPLIDVVFVILIMFILVAPLLELDRLELANSASILKENKGSVQERSPIAIHVNRNNSIVINQQATSLEQLPKVLKQLYKKYPKTRPQVFHDKRASFGTYQSVKNAVEEAGFAELDIILKPA